MLQSPPASLNVGDIVPPPPPLRSETEVMSTWEHTGTPVVSICCATYNHGGFIRDAFRGFLGQTTTFPFEVVVRDDASTDGTTDTVRFFAEHYPSIVRPIYEPINTYSQGISPGSVMYPQARGQFIAVCEGDDYWTDPNKLQIQHDILAGRGDASCSFHNVIHFDHSGRVTKIGQSHCPSRDHSRRELMTGCCFSHPATRMFRRLTPDVLYPPETHHIVNGDVFRYSILGQYGIAAYAGGIGPTAYRHHAGGIWTTTSGAARTMTHANSYYWIAEYYARQGIYPDVVRKWRRRCIRTVLSRSSLSEKCLIAVTLFFDKLRGATH